MKILLVEDDAHTSELLASTLAAHRYAVDTIADGAQGLELAARWHYDLILLDILLPTLNGVEVCRRLRAQDCQTPILMLTMKDSNEDVVAGLDAGADDYVAKSCHPSQLLARVRALLRRSSNVSVSPVLVWGLLSLDPASAQVTYDHKEVALRPKEYSLLELFLRHPQRIFSRSAIIDHLWPMEETPVEGSVTNLIKDLRQRLKSAGMSDPLIETVYGLGYRLKTVPSTDDSSSGQATVSQEDWQAKQQRGRAAIQQIQERFQSSLEQRIAALEATERSFQSGDLDLPNWQAARREVHSLAGGLGTFGCTKASEIAQAMEKLLDTTVPDTTVPNATAPNATVKENLISQEETLLTERFSELLQALKQELAIQV